MPLGKCRLCEQEKHLKESHFLPAAFYRIARAADLDRENPIVVTPNVVIQTLKQAKDVLLCGDCEPRLNQHGENWILANCWLADKNFPLHSALRATSPRYSTPTFTVYETAGVAGIDHEKLAYFGASIFWRAAVHDWTLVDKPKRLDLGPYEEQLRLFLLGEAGFRENAALMLTVGAETDTGKAEFAILPYLKNRGKDHRQYNFTMQGLTFDLFVGKSPGSNYRQMCLVRSPKRLIFMSTAMDSAVVRAFGNMMSKAKPVGKFAK